MFLCVGEAMVIKKAVCMHEEDYGILWKHTEYRDDHLETRRSRRLVISFFCTVRTCSRYSPALACEV